MSPIWIFRLSIAGALAVFAYGAWHWLEQRGYDRCAVEHQAAALHATQALHAQYVAEQARAASLSASLAAAQRQIATMRSQHEDAARAIPGTCPVGLRILHDAAAAGVELSAAARPSLAAPGATDAGAIGVAIARNYASAHECAEQLNALIDWHEGASK